MPPADILATIVDGKRAEVMAARRRTPERELRRRIADLPPTRDFAGALRRPGEVRLIAEVKKASPSAGVIRADFDPVAIAQAYAEAGAACVSVLTDERWFQGAAEHLRRISGSVELPVLRKDFVIDGYQLLEARAWGADAALLIVAVLTERELRDLSALAHDLRLAALVEVHDEREAALAVACGARLVGINNRDLTVFRTDPQTTVRLRPLLPPECLVVSESGLKTASDVALLRRHRIDAMLIGEALMCEPDLAGKTREMVRAGRGETS